MMTGSLAPASNRAGLTLVFETLDATDSTPVDISNAVIKVAIAKSRSVILEAKNGDGVEIPEMGVFVVSFTADQMRRLCPDTYDVGCTITNADSEPQQIFIGTLPVLDGVVR